MRPNYSFQTWTPNHQNVLQYPCHSLSASVQKTMLKSIITSLLDHSKPLYKKDKVHVDVNEREAQKNSFLGIFPKLVPAPPSVHLGIEMWILAKF